MAELLVTALVSYLIGSIPTSIIAGYMLKGVDIRDFGSGNAGGTNAFRVLGWKAGVLVSLVDIGKGVAATLFVSKLLSAGIISGENFSQVWCGIWAVIGHVWTIFAGFRGGKGVATAAGMLLVISPIAFAVCALWFFSIVLIIKTVSVASMTSAIILPLVLIGLNSWFQIPVSSWLFFTALAMAGFVLITHRTNLKRLAQGTENKFGN